MDRRQLLAGLLGCAAPGTAGATPPSATVGNALVRLHLTGEAGSLMVADVASWVFAGARAVERWYGAFPVRSLEVRLTWAPGRGLSGGTTYGGPSPRIVGRLGRSSAATDLYGGWVYVHELVHLACPSVPARHHWLEEGLATYVEPWVRVAVGELPVEKAWRDLVEGLPQGLPREGDRGLDRTPTWGRTYWGGALFCLLADLGIRRATRGARGLRHALQGIVAAGGSMHVAWSMERVLATGDAATGTTVLTELWREHGARPVPVDLDALWAELGVQVHGRTVRFDDGAPRAADRWAITA